MVAKGCSNRVVGCSFNNRRFFYLIALHSATSLRALRRVYCKMLSGANATLRRIYCTTLRQYVKKTIFKNDDFTI